MPILHFLVAVLIVINIIFAHKRKLEIAYLFLSIALVVSTIISLVYVIQGGF